VQKTVTTSTATIMTDYLDGFQYKNGEFQFFPTAEGFVNVTDGGKFNYVYNYTDHLGNIRVSYTLNPADGQLKILEENHYYPFGLKHSNYNVDKADFEKDETGFFAILKPVERSEFQYKYNGKEFQDELNLNWYDYHARNYDPAIGRWMNIDPLAETSRRYSPYAYCLDNPVFFIDPDGMQADDWISWIGKGGQQHITYDSSVKTAGDAEKKGYTNVEKVFEKGTGRAKSTGEVIDFNTDGTYRVNGGSVFDVDDDSFTTQGGTHISENKGVVDATGDFLPGGLQDAGDAITLAAITVAATGVGLPLAATMAEIGGIMSGIGTGLELVNDAAEGKLTVGKVVTKGVIEAVSTKIGGSNAFGPVEQIINDNIFNLLDRTIDEVKKN
jgi:RHS repeat-associated protein